MKNVAYEFEFDPYGTNPHNRISNETHTITPANGKDYSFFVPRKAPFFRRSFKLFDASNNRELIPGIDFYFGHRLDQVLISGSMQPVYSSIVMNDRTRALQLRCEYQTIGAEFVLDQAQILTMMANKTIDPRTLSYKAIQGVPSEFPPVPHRVNVDDTTGWSDVIDALMNMGDKFGQGTGKVLQSLLEHINDHANPHRITLADLGIDELGNLVPATKEEGEGGVDNTKYMTSLRVKQYCDKNVVSLIDAFAARRDNPNQVTKDQVSLGLVQNFGIATTEQAQAGRANNAYMTCLRTAEAIAALAPVAMETHTNNRNNPHGVNKDQVQLGNVLNYGVATLQQALDGIANNLYVTPYLVSEMIARGSGQSVEAHVRNTNNPHQVTKAQVELGDVQNFGIATLAEVKLANAQNKYIVPLHLSHYATEIIYPKVSEMITKVITEGGIDKDTIGLGQTPNAPFASQGESIEGIEANRISNPYGVSSFFESRFKTTSVSRDSKRVAFIAGNNLFPFGSLIEKFNPAASDTNLTWDWNDGGIRTPASLLNTIHLLVDPSPVTSEFEIGFKGSDLMDAQSLGFVVGVNGETRYVLTINKNKNYEFASINNEWFKEVISSGTLTGSADLATNNVYVRSSTTKVQVGFGTGTSITWQDINMTTLAYGAGGLTKTQGFYYISNGEPKLFTPVKVSGLVAYLRDINTGAFWKYDANGWGRNYEDFSMVGKVGTYFNMITKELLIRMSSTVLISAGSAFNSIVDSAEITSAPATGGYALALTGRTLKTMNSDDDLSFNYTPV